ncbi:hypothetical protein HK098_001576 [Nowakowskiella sp. JEL0407]|nr:hypothetical protein HK098_001576 [Nowakowskiella sp. JEL0407]
MQQPDSFLSKNVRSFSSSSLSKLSFDTTSSSKLLDNQNTPNKPTQLTRNLSLHYSKNSSILEEQFATPKLSRDSVKGREQVSHNDLYSKVPVEQWTIADVSKFLTANSLSHCIKNFEKTGIDGASLLRFKTRLDLQNIGIVGSDAEKVIEAITLLRQITRNANAQPAIPPRSIYRSLSNARDAQLSHSSSYKELGRSEKEFLVDEEGTGEFQKIFNPAFKHGRKTPTPAPNDDLNSAKGFLGLARRGSADHINIKGKNLLFHLLPWHKERTGEQGDDLRMSEPRITRSEPSLHRSKSNGSKLTIQQKSFSHDHIGPDLILPRRKESLIQNDPPPWRPTTPSSIELQYDNVSSFLSPPLVHPLFDFEKDDSTSALILNSRSESKGRSNSFTFPSPKRPGSPKQKSESTNSIISESKNKESRAKQDLFLLIPKKSDVVSQPSTASVAPSTASERSFSPKEIYNATEQLFGYFGPAPAKKEKSQKEGKEKESKIAWVSTSPHPTSPAKERKPGKKSKKNKKEDSPVSPLCFPVHTLPPECIKVLRQSSGSNKIINVSDGKTGEEILQIILSKFKIPKEDWQFYGIFSLDFKGEIDIARPLTNREIYEFGVSMNSSLRGSFILRRKLDAPPSPISESNTSIPKSSQQNSTSNGQGSDKAASMTNEKKSFKIINPLQRSSSLTNSKKSLKKLNRQLSTPVDDKSKPSSTKELTGDVSNAGALPKRASSGRKQSGKLLRFFGESLPYYETSDSNPDSWELYVSGGFTSDKFKLQSSRSPTSPTSVNGTGVDRPSSELIVDQIDKFFPNLANILLEGDYAPESTSSTNPPEFKESDTDTYIQLNDVDEKRNTSSLDRPRSEVQQTLIRNVRQTILSNRQSKLDLRKSANARILTGRQDRVQSISSLNDIKENESSDPLNERLRNSRSSTSNKGSGEVDSVWMDRVASVSTYSLLGVTYNSEAIMWRKRHTHLGHAGSISSIPGNLKLGELGRRPGGKRATIGNTREEFARKSFSIAPNLTLKESSGIFPEDSSENRAEFEAACESDEITQKRRYSLDIDEGYGNINDRRSSAFSQQISEAQDNGEITEASAASDLPQTIIVDIPDEIEDLKEQRSEQNEVGIPDFDENESSNEHESDSSVENEEHSIEEYDDVFSEESLTNVSTSEVPADISLEGHQPTRIKWDRGKLIGKGSFGRVYYGLNLVTNEIMAVKQVELVDRAGNEAMRKKMTDALYREISLLKELKQSSIVQYLGFDVDGATISVFLEYVSGGSISSLISQLGAFDDDMVRSMSTQILSGLEYLHERCIIHRDIKGANILVENDGTAKISDFGISKKNEYQMAYRHNSRMSLQGKLIPFDGVMNISRSVHWMAPEVIQQRGYSAKIDIWSLGCLVLEMITGGLPWQRFNETQAMWRLGGKNAPPIPETASDMAKDFLKSCFTIDPESRPTATQLLEHAYSKFNIEEYDFPAAKARALERRKHDMRNSVASNDSYYVDSLEGYTGEEFGNIPRTMSAMSYQSKKSTLNNNPSAFVDFNIDEKPDTAKTAVCDGA